MLHANLYKCKHFFPLHALLLVFVSFFWVGEVLPRKTPKSLPLSVCPSGIVCEGRRGGGQKKLKLKLCDG